MSTICNECSAPEGSLHHRGCFKEYCPFCFDRIMTCPCIYRRFGYQPQPETAMHPTMGLPKNIFKNGLPDDQIAEWDAAVTAEGRIPHFYFPGICTRCGTVEPGFFMVSDEEWQSTVPKNHWGDIICRECFDKMRRLVEENS